MWTRLSLVVFKSERMKGLSVRIFILSSRSHVAAVGALIPLLLAKAFDIPLHIPPPASHQVNLPSLTLLYSRPLNLPSLIAA